MGGGGPDLGQPAPPRPPGAGRTGFGDERCDCHRRGLGAVRVRAAMGTCARGRRVAARVNATGRHRTGLRLCLKKTTEPKISKPTLTLRVEAQQLKTKA